MGMLRHRSEASNVDKRISTLNNFVPRTLLNFRVCLQLPLNFTKTRVSLRRKERKKARIRMFFGGTWYLETLVSGDPIFASKFLAQNDIPRYLVYVLACLVVPKL